MKIIFMGSPDFALPTLQALHKSDEHDVIAVYSQPPKPAGRGKKLRSCPVHTFADEYGIPAYTPASLKSSEVQAEFATNQADVAVVAAYGLLLPQAILDTPQHGCINVHPSALPRWRGAAPLQRTIMAGDTASAMCIMQMAAGLDTGDVLWRETVAIPETMNAGELHDRMANLGAHGILETLQHIQNGTLTATPQTEDGVTYAQKITKEEAQIEWSQSAKQIYDHIRGLSPFPGAFFTYRGEKIKVFDAKYTPSSPNEKAGILSDQNTFSITCANGIISPKTLQRAGKQRMAVSDFLNGFEWVVGERLG